MSNCRTWPPTQFATQFRDERYAEVAYRDIVLSLATQNTEWLDLGCGRSLLPYWLPGAQEVQTRLRRICKRIAGIDLEDADVHQNPYIHERYVGNIEQLPFPDASFNLVTAQMVVEHVQTPLAMLRECARVLVPGGHLVFVTPNLENWLIATAGIIPHRVKRPLVAIAQVRRPNDIFPVYYRMNTLADIEKGLALAGMSSEWIECIDGSPDFFNVPLLDRIERWIRSVQPQARRSDLLVHARKPFIGQDLRRPEIAGSDDCPAVK